MKNIQAFNDETLYHQTSHDQSVLSDAVSIDPTNISMDSSAVFENEVYSTSTPIKTTISFPANSHEYIDTLAHSESTTSAIPSSKASTESSDAEGTNYLAMDTMIIEQLQFHPSRVWDRK